MGFLGQRQTDKANTDLSSIFHIDVISTILNSLYIFKYKRLERLHKKQHWVQYSLFIKTAIEYRRRRSEEGAM